MIKEIENMETWEAAQRWLAKHGWGIEQIREQKELWDKTHTTSTKVVKPIKEKIVTTTKEVTKKTAAPIVNAEK